MTDPEYVQLTEADLRERWRERDPLDYIRGAASVLHTEYDDPESAMRWLLKLAWGDLRDARERAINGRWSIACDNMVSRIAGLTRLVGPLDWGHVSVELVLDGWYEAIHEACGHPTPLTEADHARAREVLDRYRSQ